MTRKYQAIIFDLDDTLYDYSHYHNISLNRALLLISNDFKIDMKLLKKKYEEISINLKKNLGNVSSSHNKFIYFQHLFRFFEIEPARVNFYFLFYWKNFLNKICVYEDVITTLKLLKKITNLYLLSDYNSNETFQKLINLKIINYFNDIVTSEEIGSEKPSKKNFQYIHNIIKIKQKNRILFIGNDLQKDIRGSLNYGFDAIYFNNNIKKLKLSNSYYAFSNYKILNNILNNI
jgi:HAD superfamily hydrolase (TIGR01549 family)